ncbi:MAG TPA: GNAT family N-acetyltransferase [Pyrinomonadaceae bacterium]|nr:GNAT family N-acetyltransferase [Pyrinomonadaceae bacterium]
MKLNRTNSDDPDFRELVIQLDDYLADVDGEDHAYYAQFNGLDDIAHVVVGYDEGEPVGCGAFKSYTDEVAEIKRMFVRPEFRGRQIGSLVLEELEKWARDAGFTSCVLETGRKQVAAVKLYQNSGYDVIPNYGQYAGVAGSVCMRKEIALEQKAKVQVQ